MRGIYTITNKENKKVYVGESLNITNRWKDHIEMLKKGKHYNYKLQNDYNIYGLDSFEFKILILLDNDISNDICKYLLLYFEWLHIESYKKDDIELYNLENTLDSLMKGKRTNKNFNKKTYLRVEKDFRINKKYILFGKKPFIVMKNFLKE